MLGGKYQREVTLKGEDDLEEERSLGFSLKAMKVKMLLKNL